MFASKEILRKVRKEKYTYVNTRQSVVSYLEITHERYIIGDEIHNLYVGTFPGLRLY